MPVFFWSHLCLEPREAILKKNVGFLVETMTSKSPFEINSTLKNRCCEDILKTIMQSLKNVTTVINYLIEKKIWIGTWKKNMEVQNTIVHIAIMCLAFNQYSMCMSRMFIQGEVRYRNLSFNTWYIFSAILMKIYLFTSTGVLQCISYYYIPLAFFSSSANSQYFFMKIS